MTMKNFLCRGELDESQPKSFLFYKCFCFLGAASVLLDNKTLWVTGGESNLGCVQTTELLILNQTEWIKGPDLPECLMEHCMVKLNNDTVLITGGEFCMVA